LKRCIFTR